MNPNEYQKLAMRSQADQSVILLRLLQGGNKMMQLDVAARGLCDDCGEVSGAVKKYIEYGQPLNLENLLEEVGDCLWRLAQICDAADFTLEEAMEANIRKLMARYPQGYTDELAKEEMRDRTNEALAMRREATIVAKRRESARADISEEAAMRIATPHVPRAKRTKSEVVASRQGTGGACCNRYADQMACDCLETALPDPTPKVSDLLPPSAFVDKPKCEKCSQPANRMVTDSTRDGSRVENHYFCQDHDRSAEILGSKPVQMVCSICNNPNCDNPNGKH